MLNKKIVAGAIACIIMISAILGISIHMNTGKDYIDKLVKQYSPQGAAVVLIKNGSISEIRNYGYANTDNKIPVTEATRFKVASISKTITAYAAMKLVDEGKLDLDKPINTYLTNWKLPDTEYNEDKVTLRTLMSHTSGITGSDENGYQQPLPVIAEALKEKNIKLKREPGTVFEYSEFAGFGICQLAIEEVTGTKFEDYMANNIFQQLGMKNTDYKNENLATPYAGFNKGIEVTPIVMNGAGGVSTTAQDLAHFVIGLMNYYNSGNKEMFKPQENTRSTAGIYALGIIPRQLKNGLTVYEHNGTLTGWNAQFAFEPSSQNGMVILTNSDKAYYLTYGLMEQWGQHVIGQKVVDQQMQQIKQLVNYVTFALLFVLILLIVVFIIKIKKGIIRLQKTRKKRYILSSIIIFILGILYYVFMYTELPFKLLFQMDNYYLFTFFPLNFLWVNIMLALIAVFTVFRSGYSLIHDKTYKQNS